MYLEGYVRGFPNPTHKRGISLSLSFRATGPAIYQAQPSGPRLRLTERRCLRGKMTYFPKFELR